MTGEEAAAALKAGVEALFAEARPARPHECQALVEVGDRDSTQHYVYVAFAQGFKILEGADYAADYNHDLAGNVAAMIQAVAAEFPNHAGALAIWRTDPEYTRVQAIGASRYGPASPAHDRLYCRLVAAPIGTIGNCRDCGMVHEASDVCFLTERSLETVMRKARAEAAKDGRPLFLRASDFKNVFAGLYGSHGQ